MLRLRNALPGARAPVWVVFETGVAAAMSFFSLLLIARAIGPEAAGTGAVAIAAFLFLDLAGATLLTDALVQRAGLTREMARSAVTTQTLAGAACGVLLAALAPLIASAADAPTVLPMLLVLALLLPLSAFSGAVAGLVLREQRYRLLAMRAAIGLPLALVAGLLAAQAGLGAWAMVAQQAAATLIVFALMLRAAGQARWPRLRPGETRPLWPVAGPQFLSVVVQAGRYRAFVLALGIVAAEAVVAVANVAFRLVDSVLVVVWGTVSRLALPRFAMLQANRPALAEAYGDIAELQAVLGMPIGAGIALVAPEMVRTLLGPDWLPAAEAARIVGCAAVLSFAWGDAGSLFVAVGRTRRNLLLAVLGFAVPLGALLLLRPATPAGIALCWASTLAVTGPLSMALALRELDRSPAWLLRRVLPAAAATAVMTACVLLVQRATGDALPAPLALLLACAAGGLSYAAAAWLALGRRLPRALHAATAPAAAPAAA